MKLLTIDPGDDATHRNMGWAWFVDGWLAEAGEGDPWVIRTQILAADNIVAEHPQFYRARHHKGDPNHLFRLAKQIGIIQGIAGPRLTVVEVLPNQWKGQVPKDVCANRAAMMMVDRDTPLLPALTRTNAWDAIALGLWYLKR